MRLIIAACVVAGLMALICGFFAIARVLRRDFTQRFTDIRLHLERDANAVIDTLFGSTGGRR